MMPAFQRRPAGYGFTQRQQTVPSKPGPGRPSTPMQSGDGGGNKRPTTMGWPDQSYPSKPGPGRPSLSTYRHPGGWRAPDAAGTPAYQPGKAQPNAPKSQGTPYGVFNGGSDLAAPPSPPQPNGNMAYAPPDMRPQPFQAAYQGFDGSFSGQPNYGQRDAFIQQINNQLGQMQAQSWQNPGMGPPQFNFPQMWGQAGDMVQKGWQNPIAAPNALGGLLSHDHPANPTGPNYDPNWQSPYQPGPRGGAMMPNGREMWF